MSWDLEGSRRLAESLFPCRVGEQLEPLTLAEAFWPPEGTIYAGRLGDLDLVGCQELMDCAVSLPDGPRELGKGRNAYAYAEHSVSSWVAYSIWEGDSRVRAVSMSDDIGIDQYLGAPLEAERRYWETDINGKPMEPVEEFATGEREFSEIRSVDVYATGAAVMSECFGFAPGTNLPRTVDPMAITLPGFRLRSDSPGGLASRDEDKRAVPRSGRRDARPTDRHRDL